MRILGATTSPHKLRELREILRPLGYVVLGLDDLEDVPAEPDEPHASFVANAAHKAAYYARVCRLPTVADDSGLRVDALGGAPGVRSKRFSERSELAGSALDEANNQCLLESLRDVPDERRTAHYACAAALVPHHRTHARVCLGTCAGHILRAPRGDGGFGYDPLFLPLHRELTFAQMPPEEKNRLSHRGSAFRALGALLPTLLGEAASMDDPG